MGIIGPVWRGGGVMRRRCRVMGQFFARGSFVAGRIPATIVERRYRGVVVVISVVDEVELDVVDCEEVVTGSWLWMRE